MCAFTKVLMYTFRITLANLSNFLIALYIVYMHLPWLQQQITSNNVDMIIGKLANIVTDVSHPANQSSENLEVITTVFSRTANLIASGNISVSRSVSIMPSTYWGKTEQTPH